MSGKVVASLQYAAVKAALADIEKRLADRNRQLYPGREMKALEQASLDRVLFVPAAVPPHKQHRLLASVQHRLYALLIDLSQTGINKLIRTYGQTDKPHILQTLTMYKFILDDQLSPDLMTLQPNATNSKPYKMKPILNDDDEPKSSEMSTSNNTVDDIFGSIVDVYTPELLNIVFHALILMRDNESNYAAYADGLNKILEPTCVQLKKWIDEHIVYYNGNQGSRNPSF